MWLAALSNQPCHISKMEETCCHLNVPIKAGRMPFKEVFKKLTVLNI
jgi:hypothetical protein